jgi:hypothetical protein
MESPKLGSNRFYVVSLDIKGGSGADTISYTKLHANTIVNNYLQECRLRQVEGEITLSCVKVDNHSEYTEQEFFDGFVEILGEQLIEKLKISFT